MASSATIGRTMKIWRKVNEILWPFKLDGGAVVFDAQGIVDNPGGPLGDLRQKHGPGILELTYRNLSQTMLRKFVQSTPERVPPPTEKEWILFERKLLGTASRVIYREFKKRRQAFPRTASREKSKAMRAKAIERCLKNNDGVPITESVRRTAKEIGASIPTVWRYARDLGITGKNRKGA